VYRGFCRRIICQIGDDGTFLFAVVLNAPPASEQVPSTVRSHGEDMLVRGVEVDAMQAGRLVEEDSGDLEFREKSGDFDAA